MTNLEKYKQVFMMVFQVGEETLDEDFAFAKVEMWDSLAHMTLITKLEETFGLMFDTEDILNYGSYLNGKKILEKYGVDFSV
ncbi:acyl carrier protein [bacterium 1xD8-48]|jgi:acyl carrier protein|nr:acyl carrier protein [Lachnospiraceae bacterium]NBJ97571.1 acyl carrier protein [bacterium 1xD8-48]